MSLTSKHLPIFYRTKVFGGKNFRQQAKFSALLSAEILSYKVHVPDKRIENAGGGGAGTKKGSRKYFFPLGSMEIFFSIQTWVKFFILKTQNGARIISLG